jgi:hypothetical protein
MLRRRIAAHRRHLEEGVSLEIARVILAEIARDEIELAQMDKATAFALPQRL